MAADPDPLERVVADILDGRSVDWAAAAERLSESQRGLVEPLRLIAELAGGEEAAAAAHEAHRREEPSAASVLGTRVELRGIIGRGGFGEVYRAWDRRLQREIAVKLVRRDRPFASSLLAEARRLARVRHPSVVTIYDVLEVNGSVAICMELLHGSTLDAMVRERGPFSAHAAAQIGSQVCRALAAIHRAGLVHHDVKAHNVVLEDDGRVVLMDFGAGSDVSPRSGVVREGTPLYMAPEVLAGQPPQPASDLYALGVLLYFLVTGSYPVAGRTVGELRHAHARGEAKRQALLHLPPPLHLTVARALDVVPSTRFASADALAEALTAAGGGRATRTVLGIGTGLVLLLTTLLVVASPLRMRDARRSAPSPTIVKRIAQPPDMTGYGGLSPDGARLVFETGDGSLKILTLESGQSTLLVPARSGVGRTGLHARFRPTRRTIVFPWQDEPCKCVELREIDEAGGVPRRLLRVSGFTDVFLEDVAADGDHVLVRAEKEEGKPSELGIVRLTAPSYRGLIQVPAGMEHASLSPDGRWIAYDRKAAPGDLNSDLFVLDTSSGRSQVLLDGSWDDGWPFWERQGDAIAFFSNRAGTRGLWRLAVQGGEPVGTPILAYRDVSRAIPLELSGDRLVYFESPVRDIELAPFDEEAGRLTGSPARPALPFAGLNSVPEWSPDGRFVVYVSERGTSGPMRSVIVVHSTADGAGRDLVVPINGPLEPKWSPDGRSLLVRGPGAADGVRGARIVSAIDGEITHVYPWPGVWSPEWARDGLSYFFGSDQGLHRMDVATGRATRIDLGRRSVGRLSMSRDGSLLCVMAFDEREGGGILLVPTAEPSAYRLLLSRRGPIERLPVPWDWTPNGRWILATEHPAVAFQDDVKLVAISVQDGSIHPTGLKGPGLGWVSVRPDGRELVYNTGWDMRTLWMLEHYSRDESRR